MGGSPEVNVPGPTQQEVEIQKMQLELMREQAEMTKSMQPYLLESLGFTMDPNTGEITKREEEVDPVKQALEERTMKALKGELDVSPTLTKDIESRRGELEASLSSRLGPNWRGTTAGIQALQEFENRAAGLMEDVRHGEITSGTAMLGSREGLLSDLQSASQSRMSTISTPYSQTIGTSGGLLSPYMEQRKMQLSANQQNAQMANERAMGMMQMVGQIGGSAAMMSDRRLKKNIKLIGTYKQYPVYSFNYISGGPVQIGVMADEVRKVNPDAVTTINGYLAVDYGRL